MTDPLDPAKREELFELYAELHLACGRAAAALRLSGHWDAPVDELMARFRQEEDRAAAIWKRIQEVRGW